MKCLIGHNSQVTALPEVFIFHPTHQYSVCLTTYIFSHVYSEKNQHKEYTGNIFVYVNNYTQSQKSELTFLYKLQFY